MKFIVLVIAAASLLATPLHAQTGIGQIGAGQILGNSTGARAPAGPETVTAILDRALGATQGRILCRNNTAWQSCFAPILGIPGTAQGSFGLAGATSGTATLRAQAAAGTPTLFLPTLSGTLPSTAVTPLSLDGTTGVLSCATCLTATAALTRTNDTNVTLTLGGSPGNALVNATSLTLGWAGTLAVSRGGTGAATLTAGLPIIGAGTSPLTAGGKSGSTTTFATVTGSLPSNNCVKFDASGNLVDAGAPCAPANSWVTPEQYGAVGNGSTDDAAAFTSLCADIAAGTVHWVRMGAGKTYNIWNTAPATQTVLCALGSANGVRWDFNGARFNIPYAGTAITYVFTMAGAKGIEINDLAGTAATGKQVSGTLTGVNWVSSLCLGSCTAGFGVTNLTVNRANVDGCINGVAIVRSFGVGAYSTNIKVNGSFQNCGYPVSNQADGLNTTFDIVTVNAGRSYIGYNVANVTGAINSTNGTAGLEDVYITAYGYSGGGSGDISTNTTTNINITYANQKSATYGTGFFGLAHQQGDSVTASIPTNISNVRIRMSILLNSSPNTTILTSVSTTGTSGSQVAGDPGNFENNIILEGRIQGDLNAAVTYAGYYMSTALASSGWNGTSKGTFVLENLQAPNLTKSWVIGTGANVEFRNINIPNSNRPSFDAGANPNFQTYRNAIFGGAGQYPINSTGFNQSCYIGANFQSANTDYVIPIPSSTTNYRVLSVVIANASASLASSTIGVFTAASGGGTAVVTTGATTITTGAANTNNNLQFLTVNNSVTQSFNFTQLYARIGTASAGAATADICVQFTPLL